MNEKFEPVGLIEISRQIKSSLKKVSERQPSSALNAKRDVASRVGDLSAGYVEQLDPAKIEEAMKRNETVWKAGYDVGYTEGFKAGSITSTEPASEQRDRDLLESHGINVNRMYVNVKKMIEDHEEGIDEDDPDQYPKNYGGTK
jgi:hypothetical protein